MLRTRMVSLTPAIPGRRAHVPRTQMSIGTPTADARYSASMVSSSTTELLDADAGLPPCHVVVDFPIDAFDKPGPHGMRGDDQSLVLGT